MTNLTSIYVENHSDRETSLYRVTNSWGILESEERYGERYVMTELRNRWRGQFFWVQATAWNSTMTIVQWNGRGGESRCRFDRREIENKTDSDVTTLYWQTGKVILKKYARQTEYESVLDHCWCWWWDVLFVESALYTRVSPLNGYYESFLKRISCRIPSLSNYKTLCTKTLTLCRTIHVLIERVIGSIYQVIP